MNSHPVKEKPPAAVSPPARPTGFLSRLRQHYRKWIQKWMASAYAFDYTLFFLLVLWLTILYSPVALQPPYLPEIGDIALKDVQADVELLVEDRDSTRRRREEAEQRALSIYDWDPGMVDQIFTSVRESLVWLAHLRRYGTPLSEEALRQVFMQRLNEEITPESFRALLALDPLAPTEAGIDVLQESGKDPPAREGNDGTADMVAYGYADLLEIIQLWLRPLGQQRVVNSTDTIRDMERGPYIINSLTTGREIRLVGAVGVISLEEMRLLMMRTLRDRLSGVVRPVQLWLLEETRAQLRPNVVLNLAETNLRKQRAVDAVESVYFRVRRGELVLRKGDVVTAATRLKIESINQDHWTGLSVFRIAGLSGTLILLLLLSRWFLIRTSDFFPRDRKTLYILGTILMVTSLFNVFALLIGRGLASMFGWTDGLEFYLPPVSLGAAMASLTIGARLSLPGGSMVLGAILSFLTSLAVNGGLAQFVYYFAGSLAGSLSMRVCRHRFDLLRAGLWIGVVQMFSVPIVEALSGHVPEREWLVAMSLAFASGLLDGFLALAIIPVFERVFNLTTDSRLLELASGDHPLLKQLSLRTPGTYHHSVMMGNLAEAAAESIGANPLMARVMALYHDIGKMNKPHYFVENQSGENRHDHLLPSMSAKIIMAHIKDGVELARQYKLGGPILEAITTHQGTSLLQFFYNKALNEASRRGETVMENDYRYPGPKPQTRESGVLMLADSVEAAARTLKNPSPAQIQALVHRLIHAKIADHQLDECRLTLRELAVIEDAFCRVLTLGFYHQRIAYPDLNKRRHGNN
ncbi:MAG: HDIG domain-containing protein [Magnetococcales bacterium]|nr:HDIG domain-containing protein [Magnetococcales bacterium]